MTGCGYVKRITELFPTISLGIIPSINNRLEVAVAAPQRVQKMTKLTDNGLTLESFIEHMRQGLNRLGFDIEEVNWLNPVPHVWSLQLQDKQCSLLCAQGRGVNPEAALASAFAHFYERLSTHAFFADYYFGSHFATQAFEHFPDERWFPATAVQWPPELLDEHSRNHYDPDDELAADMLIDLNSGRAGKGVCALPFIRQTDGVTVWFPVNVLDNLYSLNGMAAGKSRFEARVNAMLGVFERHIQSTIIANAISLPRIPAKVIARYPRVETAIKALRVKGFMVDVRDASLGGKYPLVCVSVFNRDDGGCCTHFGAHPKFEHALERALTGLLQSAPLESFSGMPSPTFDLNRVATPRNVDRRQLDSSGRLAWDMFCEESDYPFTEWNIEGAHEDEWQALCQLIHTVDLQIYLAEYDQFGVNTCRVIVPGMSEIKPVSALIWGNNNALVGMRESLLSPETIDSESALDLLDELEQRDIDNALPLAKLLGLATDPETAWGLLSVGGIKLRLALRGGDLNAASRYVMHTGTDALGSNNPNALKRCLSDIISIAIDDRRQQSAFERPLKSLYGEEVYQTATDWMHGENPFKGLGNHDQSLHHFETHQALLAVFQRLRKVAYS